MGVESRVAKAAQPTSRNKCNLVRAKLHRGLSAAAGCARAGRTRDMDLMFILSAAIFTLLAIVVATSLLNGSSTPVNGAQPLRGPSVTRAADAAVPGVSLQNGHVPDGRMKEKKEEENWCDISGSSHDHWDVVKSVQTVIRREGRAASELLLFCTVASLGLIFPLDNRWFKVLLVSFVVHSS